MIYQKRPEGYQIEQPSLFGSLKVRIPFIHMKFEVAEFVQGALLCVLPMSGSAIWADVFGIPFEAAVLMLCINNYFFLLHPFFGCPSVAGWITAGLPLYIMYYTSFPEEQRIQALIALQLTVGLVFLVLHASRLADAFMKRLPVFLKCGILLGAGMSAIIFEVDETGRMWKMPISMGIALVFAFFMMFSSTTEKLKQKYGMYRFIAQFGIAIPFAIALVFGTLIGEIPKPVIEWYFIPSSLTEIMGLTSVFAVGFPAAEMFVRALPTALAAYVIAYGDILVIDSLIKVADVARRDEQLTFSVTRVGIICAIRNFIEGICFPHIAMCGPMVGGPQAMVINRYVKGTRKEMDSYWGGCWSMCFGMSTALLIGPFVSLLRQGAPLGMTLNLVIQGFLCGYVAVNLLREQTDGQKGMACVVGAFIAALGASWGLLAGILLWIIVDRDWMKKTILKPKEEYKPPEEEKKKDEAYA